MKSSETQTSETKCSPLPFDVTDTHYIDDANGNIVAVVDVHDCDIEIAKANAALIVNVVNCHDDLVEALNAIRKRFDSLLSDDPMDAELNRIREIAHKPFYKIIDEALAKADSET